MDSNSYFISKDDVREDVDFSFAERVGKGEKTILYEIVPPPINKEKTETEESLSLIASLLSRVHVDAINIPEVHEEKRNGERNSKNIEKLEPRLLGTYLRKAGFKEIIINRPVVYLPWSDQRRWLREAYRDNFIRNFIFVGGESSRINYPGLSVSQAAKAVTETYNYEFPDIFLGGITIPTRSNEAERLLKKTQSGIGFFTSQILYESKSIKRLLEDYWNLCLETNTQAKMIFLSFAPVTSKKDIDLLSWLGVDIPKEIRDFLTGGWLGTGWRSLEVCRDILEDVFRFVTTRNIQVPVGINVGYINRHNFEFSVVFLEQLGNFYLQGRNGIKTRGMNFDLGRSFVIDG